MQSSKQKGGFSIRSLFLKGALFALPVAVTFLVVRFALNLADSWLGPATTTLVGRHIPGLSLIFILLALTLLGAICSWSVGRRLLGLIEKLLLAVPGASAVYSAMRQVVGLFETSKTRSHQRVVMVTAWPDGGRVPAFVVDSVIDQATGRKNLVVCIPSKPNPTGATVMIVPEDTTCDAGMTPDQALRWGMSLGMNTPPELPITGPKRTGT
jgi:uncharacterized membrane protein